MSCSRRENMTQSMQESWRIRAGKRKSLLDPEGMKGIFVPVFLKINLNSKRYPSLPPFQTQSLKQAHIDQDDCHVITPKGGTFGKLIRMEWNKRRQNRICYCHLIYSFDSIHLLAPYHQHFRLSYPLFSSLFSPRYHHTCLILSV